MIPSLFERRYSASVSTAIWALWTLVALAASTGPLLWHVQYFERVGSWGPVSLVICLVLLAGGSVLYSRVRAQGLWRWEPAIFLTIAAVACLAREPTATLVAVLLVLAASGFGSASLRMLNLTVPSAPAATALPVAIGAGWLALLLFLLGLARRLEPTPIAVLLVAGCCLGFWQWSQTLDALRSGGPCDG